MKKTKLWWITRDMKCAPYFIWTKKPYWDSDRWRGHDLHIQYFYTDFESLTRIKMKGGKDSIMCVKGFTPKVVKR